MVKFNRDTKYKCGASSKILVIQHTKGKYCYCTDCGKVYDRTNNMKNVGKYDGKKIVLN